MKTEKKSITQLPRWISEMAQRQVAVDRQIAALLINEDIETDEALEQLGALYEQNRGIYTAKDWEPTVIGLTYHITKRCRAFDEYVVNNGGSEGGE